MARSQDKNVDRSREYTVMDFDDIMPKEENLELDRSREYTVMNFDDIMPKEENLELDDEVEEENDEENDEEDLLGSQMPVDDTDRHLMPPPPPVSSTTVDTEDIIEDPTPRAKKASAASEAGARRLRVNDVHIEPSPTLLAAGQHIKEEATPHASVSALTLDHYDVAKRLVADQHNGELGDDVGGASKIGDTAAQVNHYLMAISEVRSRVDPAILSQLPYTVQTTGAHIGRAFYMQALTTAPHLSRPVSEMTDVLRRMASQAKCVRRRHIEAMTRTARLGEETCANKESCCVFAFRDRYNVELPHRRQMVAFLYENELPLLRTDRASLTAIWRKRACVQCMLKAANRLVTNLRCKNQAIDARPYLAIPFYVEVDTDGEYPVGATLGPGKRLFESLLFNLVRFSELDWQETTQHDASVAGSSEEVIYYVNTAIPPFPVPKELLQAYTRQGFSAAL
jgi:hypothetical protein